MFLTCPNTLPFAIGWLLHWSACQRFSRLLDCNIETLSINSCMKRLSLLRMEPLIDLFAMETFSLLMPKLRIWCATFSPPLRVSPRSSSRKVRRGPWMASGPCLEIPGVFTTSRV
ncbi:hypothetical protein BGW80DRAFT_1334861 [Lactifluus volemus]|nr:hypothetical protein BGW80DRAFT_1334861 [Lactifluus volemus]